MTIRTLDRDPRVAQVISGAVALGLPALKGLAVADVVHIDGDLSDDALQKLHGLLVDPLLQMGTWSVPTGRAVEVGLLAGVTDTAADAVHRAAEILGIDIDYAATGFRVEFDEEIDEATMHTVVARLLVNPVIQRWTDGTIEPARPGTDDATGAACRIAIRGLDDSALAELNAERSLSLDPEELRAIQEHFDSRQREPTDVEIETLAQTWSEHCAHKTFQAVVHALDPRDAEPTERLPLMQQLRSCTADIDAPFVRSAFVGNAGVVEFHKGTTLALKAETHNHPSAVEPFGGANTGVGGVIRDVLGIAHRPIAITDVLCFGPTDLPLSQLPDGTLHPRRVEAGVIGGVADYGNKIGLPTVAGAILYDPAYTTNPLVFAGCIGTADSRALHEGPQRGDRVLLLGGATGRDGIRGATFSSATMDATTGEVAGASVQIGDPIVEKLLIDVLVGAEDMYSAITDCGAGGLSSAIGEMADGIGADVDLALVPRKYPGLEPWEVWLSEAQERMVVSVPPRAVSALARRCEKYGVEWSDLGSFTGDGVLIVRNGDDIVAELDTEFLHGGRPQRHMNAMLPEPERSKATSRTVDDPAASLLALLRHPNIASKAATIHRYDHEVLGATVVRPLVGAASDGPADGVVIAAPADSHGVAIGIGVNPWYGMHDPEAMAFAVVDEAVRNAVAVGADPDRIALLDNFSWGDPRRGSTLGDLVAAVDGCCAAAYMFNAPFVSGKDSLNNEYVGADGEHHAVPPTLVITAVGHVPDASQCVTPALVTPGNRLMLIGSTETEFAGSHFDLVHGEPDQAGVVPAPDTDAAIHYRDLHAAMRAGLVVSCHDVSDGGLAVALAEMCIGGRLGATITELPHDDLATALFSESMGRLVVEVEDRSVAAFLRIMEDSVLDLGAVTESKLLSLPGVEPVLVADLADAFNSRAQTARAAMFAEGVGPPAHADPTPPYGAGTHSENWDGDES